jgi:TetR/AcrR family transcriptional regulator, cholesterol catabolism regulator
MDAMASAGGGGLSPTAQRIMQAADDLFFRQGAVATTVREITAACGLTPGALYNHFRSKDDLLFRLVMQRHLLLADALDDALAGAPTDPVAQLDIVVRVYARIHLHPEACRGSRVANREYRGLTGQRLAQVVAVRRSLRDQVVRILEDGTARGVFTVCGGGDRASLVVAAATILDMCVHAAEWVREDGPLSARELEERYVSMACRLAGAR